MQADLQTDSSDRRRRARNPTLVSVMEVVAVKLPVALPKLSNGANVTVIVSVPSVSKSSVTLNCSVVYAGTFVRTSKELTDEPACIV
jgi:hypothetical protein